MTDDDIEHAVQMTFLLGRDGEDRCIQQAIDFLVERWPDLTLTRGAPKVDHAGPFLMVTVYFRSDTDWRPE